MRAMYAEQAIHPPYPLEKAQAYFRECEALLRADPSDGDRYLKTAYAALAAYEAQAALRYLERLQKRFVIVEGDSGAESALCRAVAYAMQGKWYFADRAVSRVNVYHACLGGIVPDFVPHHWLDSWITKIFLWKKDSQHSGAREDRKSDRGLKRSVTPRSDTERAPRSARAEFGAGEKVPGTALFHNPAHAKVKNSSSPGTAVIQSGRPAKVPLAGTPPQNVQHENVAHENVQQEAFDTSASNADAALFPKPALTVPTHWTLPEAIEVPKDDDIGSAAAKLQAFMLRYELDEAGLISGFDALLALDLGLPIDQHWYQVETARKVLKHFHGRVLLADEVGLGKTIEALLVLKEYMLRGLVRRFLVLCPPTLVGQWEDELAHKFLIAAETTSGALYQRDPRQFWSSERLVASIAIARREENMQLLLEHQFDLVIVDEAHHLRNRTSRNWKLVDALKKRFMLLLSATPVQNNVEELFSLLTILKPGIFKSLADFKRRYVARISGGRRSVQNTDALRALMREIMIRNTRALVDIRLPSRHAVTLRTQPSALERELYEGVASLVREAATNEPTNQQRFVLRHLIEAVGSSPAAAEKMLAALRDCAAKEKLLKLAEHLHLHGPSSKCEALCTILKKNPAEKKMIFVRLIDTLKYLESTLAARGFQAVTFHGGLSALERDRVIERFRDEVPILLCTDSAGEGRNVQFCNTIINFDLPWNPQAIEQRIGRVHRIGQTREVYVFNLVAADTIEDQILRILDEKLHMFELIVGEAQAIIGELDDDREFASRIFEAWIETSLDRREAHFADLIADLTRARSEYESSKALDDQLFGRDLEVV